MADTWDNGDTDEWGGLRSLVIEDGQAYWEYPFGVRTEAFGTPPAGDVPGRSLLSKLEENKMLLAGAFALAALLLIFGRRK